MHYLDLTYPEISRNLALDEALLVAAEERETGAVLRIWEPHDLAVVLGASCRQRQDVHVDRCRQDGVAIARRSSGGGTVVVGPGTLNVTVVLRADFGPGLWAVDVAQKYVLERFAESLRTCGPPVEVLGLGDLTVDRRKFSGSAQRRLRHHFLVHATILYDFPLEVIPRYTAQPLRQPEYRAGRSHEDFLMNVGLPRATLVAALRSAWDVPDESAEPFDLPEDMVRDLAAAKFADPEWVARL